MDQYECVKKLGSGNFGVTLLMRHKETGESVAVKQLPRGNKINKNVYREVLNHRKLSHPNVIGFKAVHLDDEHLNIVMEYASGGELFGLIRKTRRFPENDARYFFQQLICGLEYLHAAGVTHRDIKLENTLIGGTRPGTLVKICDFGYSKRPEVEQSQCKSIVGTPAYLAPEVLASKPYKGAGVDVWSCGVLLYVMLVGAYPFEDPTDRTDFQKIVSKIMALDYKIPEKLQLSDSVKDLLGRIFVKDPESRITIAEIKKHEWYLHRLPFELCEGYQGFERYPKCTQDVEEIKRVLNEARTAPAKPSAAPTKQAAVTSPKAVPAAPPAPTKPAPTAHSAPNS